MGQSWSAITDVETEQTTYGQVELPDAFFAIYAERGLRISTRYYEGNKYSLARSEAIRQIKPDFLHIMDAPATVPSNNTADSGPSRKGHARRESTGHLCTACDQCYRCKVKCSGEKPSCERCLSNKSACTYSTGKPLGKPKGSKNKVPRSKTGSHVARQSTIPDKSLLPSPPQLKKRPSDGPLPQVKRTVVGELAQTFEADTLPNIATTKQIASTPLSLPSTSSHDPIALSSDSGTYYDGRYPTREHDISTMLGSMASNGFESAYPSAGVNLDIDDFRWFTTPHAEPFVAPTPTASLSIPTQTTSFNDVNSYNSFAPIPEPSPPQSLDLTDSQYQECSCDPLSLGIISELHTLQVNLSPLDTALLLARRGLSTVSAYLTCPACSNHFSTTPSLFLACVLILQQVFACYVTLRLQGTRMLTAKKRADSPLAGAAICIGEFEVEGDESRNALLDTIVRSEIERGKSVIGNLEQWAGRVGEGKDLVAGVLLQSLREEIRVV